MHTLPITLSRKKSSCVNVVWLVAACLLTYNAMLNACSHQYDLRPRMYCELVVTDTEQHTVANHASYQRPPVSRTAQNAVFFDRSFRVYALVLRQFDALIKHHLHFVYTPKDSYRHAFIARYTCNICYPSSEDDPSYAG
jgi:hypothetical protein